MAKPLREDEIGQDTLIEYLDTKSDFHFELKILKMMKDHGLPCEHGGHYVDPVTQKSREFDIRCRIAAGRFRLQLAVECKNLRVSNPLLVTAVARTKDESYHQAAVIVDPTAVVVELAGQIITREPEESRAQSVRVRGRQSIYPPGEPVGKSTAQVGLSKHGEPEIVAGDSDIYEKWGQCLSSLTDLVGEMEDMRDAADHTMWLAATAIPILVVPDRTLWRALYADDGSRAEDPRRVDHVSMFAGKRYRLGNWGDKLSISHVEIMTESGLKGFIRQSLLSAEAISSTFFANVDPPKPPRERF